MTAEREDKSITRNSSFFKPIRGPVQIPSTNDDETDDIPEQSDGDVLRRSHRERRPPDYLKTMLQHRVCKKCKYCKHFKASFWLCNILWWPVLMGTIIPGTPFWT